MAGISDKAIKSSYAENKYRFNKGSELQNKEFSDGSGLEMYETHLRELDPQLGRWWQLDPAFTNGVDGTDEVNDVITEGLKSQSPYASMDNNPVRLDDPKGDAPDACCDLAGQIATTTSQWVEETDLETGELITLAGISLTSAAALVDLGGGGDPNAFLPHDVQLMRDKMLRDLHADMAAQSRVMAQGKKGPKDLAQEGKDAIAKREADKARAAQRQAQTAQGKTKVGKSNQAVRGDHNTGAKRGDKHGKRIERAQREQKAADAAKEAAKKKGNSNG